MTQLHQVECSTQFWARLDECADLTISREWVEFVADTQGATPVAAELRDGSSVLGYFCGLVFRRFGFRILGSPFPGWTTSYMGFALDPGVPRWMALAAVERFAFRELGCMHFEMVDRYLTVEDGRRVGVPFRMTRSYETDLRWSEEDLFRRMTGACRRCIRKAAREGVVIEEAQDDAFASEYYEQLKMVFLRQQLVPTYDLGRVHKLIEHFLPTQQLLLLRARDPEGRCIATGIYPAINRIAHFWGTASVRARQHLRPNEALHWYAMRHWQKRGISFFDWGGAGRYKEKYGCYAIAVPRFFKSRLPEVGYLRDQAELLARRRQRVTGWLKSKLQTSFACAFRPYLQATTLERVAQGAVQDRTPPVGQRDGALSPRPAGAGLRALRVATGPDDSNHAQRGSFILAAPAVPCAANCRVPTS